MSLLKYTDIAKIFEEIELRLIANLKRNLTGHKREESKEGFNWSAWQAEKLKSLDSFRKQNNAVMNEYTELIDEQTRELMEEQFAEGEALDGERTDEPETENFFGVNENKMNSLIEDITSIEKTVETAAVRNMDDVYRQTVNRVQLAMASGEMTLNQAIDTATKDFLSAGINNIVYANGRRVNIADYVRMALRTTSNRATLQGRAKAFNELGYDTVLISQYGGCSKTCEPWQGKPYIDDVFTEWNGENDGSTGISNYCGEQFPLLSAAIRGGLFHPNCRHTMSLYVHGQTKIPEPIPEEKIKKQRELEQHQRYLERKIRRYKRLEAGTMDAEQAKLYTQKRKQAQKELSEFIKANDKALKRDYFREKVYTEDLTNERESGIIELKTNLFSESDPLYIDTFSIEEENGFEDICLHGSSSSVQCAVDGETVNMSAHEFAEYLKNSSSYKGGNIRLASCSTGKGDNSFAQQLSKELDVIVKAPDSDVYYAPDEGTLFVGSPYSNVGNWRMFDKGEEIK